MIRRFVVPVTVDEYGDAEAYTPVLSGKVVSIRFVKPGSNGFGEYSTFVITSEASGETIWSEEDVDGSTTRYPRAATHATAGTAATYNGTQAVLNKIALSQDRVKIVVSDAGDATDGIFHITVDG